MVSLIFLVAAIIVFLLAAFGVEGPIALVPLGLALFAAAHLPWRSIRH